MDIFPGYSAVDSLYLSTDRAIPDHLLAAAYAYDAAEAAKRGKRARIRPGSLRIKDTIAVQMMTRQIGLCLSAKGCVERDDFKGLGLTADQIDSLSQQAYAYAVAATPGLIALTGVPG